MRCAGWQERIAWHAGGDAAPGEAEQVDRHLEQCAECRELWAGLRESLATLRAMHRELPDAAHFTAVRTRVLAEIHLTLRVWRNWAWVSGMAAMLVFLLGLAIWPRQTSIPVAPRMAAAIPGAPLVRSVRRQHVARVRQQKREPLTIRLQTSDPNIVIYWIAE
jgi:anti-sigma factor RsiW